jgi:peptidoglycan/xylan/chitin deacetylase (PgdA/CDA1 family)
VTNSFNSPPPKQRSRKSSSSARQRYSGKVPHGHAAKKKRAPSRTVQMVMMGGVLMTGLAAVRQIHSSAQGASSTPGAHPKIAALPKKTAAPEKADFRSLTAIPNWTRGHAFRHGFTKEKVIALTFDDGPFPIYTRQVLDILKQNDIQATFFMIGKMVKYYPKIARTVRDAGHVIGNHSWAHPSKPKAPNAEVDETAVILKSTLGETAPLFRPPYGLMHNGMADRAEHEKQAVIIWNSAGADWSKEATVGSIVSQVMRNARPGGIILLHDGGGNRSSTVQALPIIIEKLRAQGYRFVTVPELLALSEKPVRKLRIVKSKTKKVRLAHGMASSKPAKSSQKKPVVARQPGIMKARPIANPKP